MPESPGTSVGLALIVRDEEDALPRLLDSVSGCFDQVALLDTGSTDATVALFDDWARAETRAHPGFEGRAGSFRWCDDFAAARNAADALLGTAWLVWADADDEIRGAHHLRGLAATAPADVAAFVARYETAHDATGQALCRADRIRMVRRARGRWQDPVHERLVVEGGLASIPPATTLWVHRKDLKKNAGDGGRNLRILRAWLEREPGNLRALAHAGREEAERGHHAEAVDYFRRFVDASDEWNDERAQVHRQLAQSLIALGRLAEAAEDAAAVAAAMPDWPDSYLTLAEVALESGDCAGAVANASRVLELGPPESALLQVTSDYTARPRLLIARALQRSGDREAARRAAAGALDAIVGA